MKSLLAVPDRVLLHDLAALVARELPLDDAARAHREIMSAKAAGKIVLVP